MTEDRQLRLFAEQVQKLRVLQKANGSGYKTSAGSKEAAAAEKLVDDEIIRLIGNPKPKS